MPEMLQDMVGSLQQHNIAQQSINSFYFILFDSLFYSNVQFQKHP